MKCGNVETKRKECVTSAIETPTLKTKIVLIVAFLKHIDLGNSMYCDCKDKKPLTNEANKVTFTVCAKSKGGCGREIGDSFKWKDITSPDLYVQSKYCLECDGDGVKLRLQHNGITKPETCKRCRGSGMEMMI
jgi:hypothetical protein